LRRFRFLVKVDPIPGTGIRDVAEDAIEFARQFGCGVEFKFNGAFLVVGEADDPDAIVARFDRQMERVGGGLTAPRQR
jgi:hypothetical protein